MAPSSAISPDNALSEEWLGRTDRALAFYKDLRDRYMPGAPIWLNETAQASCGGDKWASTFLDSFRYVDQMGRLAKQGVSAVFHNTLAASDYGLIDEATMTPRPNYWAAVLWGRLMGDRVLDAGQTRPGLHIYAHCLRNRSGGVALATINLDRDTGARVSLPSAAEIFALTADELQARSVKLNDKVLAMNGEQLPTIRPLQARAGEVFVRPASITFIAIPSAANESCK